MIRFLGSAAAIGFAIRLGTCNALAADILGLDALGAMLAVQDHHSIAEGPEQVRRSRQSL
jgi:hypothetical protein